MISPAASAAARAAASAESRNASVSIVYNDACSRAERVELTTADFQAARSVGLRLADELQCLAYLRICRARGQPRLCLIHARTRRERAGKLERAAQIVRRAGDGAVGCRCKRGLQVAQSRLRRAGNRGVTPEDRSGGV